MASRLCHDLVGPIGAIRNGLEIAGDDPEMAEEAMGLTQDSVEKLAATTQLFRMAYGAAGDSLDPQDGERLLRDYLKKYRIELTWRVTPVGLEPAMPKLLLNAAILASEALPRGGEIEVVTDGADMGRVSARGQDVRPPRASLAVLAGSDEPTAQTLQGEVLRVFSARAGLSVDCTEGDGKMTFSFQSA